MGEYKGFDDPRADHGEPLTITPTDDSQGMRGQPEDGVNNMNPAGDPAPAPNTFDPNSWTLNYRGQQIIPKDREHLINLAQQGYSYSQSMAELNQRKKEIEAQEAKYKGYSALDSSLSEHPELAEKINRVYQEYISGSNSQNDSDDQDYRDPRVDSLYKELQDIKTWREQQLNRDADNELNNTIDNLRKKYPDHPWDQNDGTGTFRQKLIQHALDRDITNIELAYKDMVWDSLTTNSSANALKKAKEQIQRNNLNGVVDSGTSPGPGGGIKYDPSDDYGDISRKAIKLLGG